MLDDPKRAPDPGEVVTREDGSQIRPGRFVSDDASGIAFAEPGEDLPEDEDDPALADDET